MISKIQRGKSYILEGQCVTVIEQLPGIPGWFGKRVKLLLPDGSTKIMRSITFRDYAEKV